MSILRDRFIDEHINKNYPNAKIINYNDPDSALVFYSAEELQAVEDDWFPLCCYKDPQTGKAVYGGRKKIFHTYTEGETGAGKTSRFVMQSILALSSMKNKPSFVIVDIHGEIIENLYTHLKKNGYDIKILNCDNPQRSDTYNPFSELTEECLKTQCISNDTINKIRKISEIIQPVESTNDPIWDRGARSYTNGCILDKFEDLISGDLPAECMTIYNVIQNHHWLRDELARSPRGNNLFDIPHYKKKGIQALSAQKMISVTNNADKTRASYFGVVENHYDTFGQPSLYSLSSNNTIDISDFIDKPTVIVIQSGSTKIGDNLISLLVNEIYTYIVKIGKDCKSKRLPRNIHCFLDEFANCNIADGTEYIKMLTTSRKFGMFWHMILQCDAQLERKFDSNIARIIRANSTEIFMGSHDYETAVRFAKSCGQKTIEALASIIEQKDPRLEVVDLMTTEKLNLTEEGYIYVKSNRHPLLKTYIEAFYNCSEFVPVEDIDLIYPYNDFDYQQTAFFPDELPQVITIAEYDLLQYIREEKKSLQELQEHFSIYDVTEIIKSLARNGAVALLKNHMVSSNITERQFDLYDFSKKNGLNRFLTAENQENGNRGVNNSSANANKPAKLSTKEIEAWFSGAVTDNPLLEDIRKHLEIYNGGYILTKLRSFTCVPDFFLNAIRFFMMSKEEQTENTLDFPKGVHTIKFEIIEEFIKNNAFSTKEKWQEKLQYEYDYLLTENLFPDSVLQKFEVAIKEFQELSLSEIREIKKIVTENN
ncbi:MAG: type IV secretory system conjugative DNA transfer family protein [Clostridia bacterium]|nr:type IV secretory system conjugative DNA transfer family protein [Clostridia bacterium]